MTYHLDYFLGGYYIVYVGRAVLVPEFVTHGLEFFGGTGHYGDGYNPLSAIAEVFLYYGTEHLHWRAAGGNIFQYLRVTGFRKAYPGRAAGGVEGQLAACLEALKEFTALFKHRKVGAGGGVEHLVKAHAAQGGYKLAHGKVAVFFVKGLAYTCAYGRGDLSDYARITIRKVFP